MRTLLLIVCVALAGCSAVKVRPSLIYRCDHIPEHCRVANRPDGVCLTLTVEVK